MGNMVSLLDRAYNFLTGLYLAEKNQGLYIKG